MSIVWLAAVAAAMFFGFCAGRMTLGEGSAEEMVPETGSAAGAQEKKTLSSWNVRAMYEALLEKRTGAAADRWAAQGDPRRDRRAGRYYRGNVRSDSPRNRENHGEQRRSGGCIGSPVSGFVEDMWQDSGRSVVIRPEEDRLYAPAGGKILKLFPLGNAFLFRTELGVELYIQAGAGEDELLGRYYRPRVVRNEIVGKGKLLLEFDRQGLEAEGVSPVVSVTVESGMYGGRVSAVAGGYVRTGEEILRIQRQQE